MLEIWINPVVISDIISIPNIEKAGYCVTYYTQEEWVVHAPEVNITELKRESRECGRTTFINIINTEAEVIIFQKSRNSLRDIQSKRWGNPKYPANCRG